MKTPICIHSASSRSFIATHLRHARYVCVFAWIALFTHALRLFVDAPETMLFTGIAMMLLSAAISTLSAAIIWIES